MHGKYVRLDILCSPCAHTWLSESGMLSWGREGFRRFKVRGGGGNVGCSGSKLTREEGGTTPRGGSPEEGGTVAMCVAVRALG